MIAKDFFNKELNIGDEVAFMQIGYRNLKRGIIIRISDKTILIEHEKFNCGGTTTKQFHDQVIKK
jgi:hypothetical protein